MRIDRRTCIPKLILAAALVLAACGRQLSEEEQTAAWLEQGEHLLSGAAMAAIGGNDLYRTWDLENGQTRIDEERFPEWARGQYDACVYWEAPYTVSVYNDDRRPGNSAMYLKIPCIAWGWMLVGEGDAHFLELSNEYDTPSSPNRIIDAWEPPKG